MSGTLPTELSNLAQLKYLELSNNNFNGSFPVTLISDLDYLGECILYFEIFITNACVYFLKILWTLKKITSLEI